MATDAESVKKRILAIDDENAICAIYERALEREGYLIETFKNAPDALVRLEQVSFDLILMDLILQGLNGWDLMRKAKKISPSTPIIVVTGRPELDSVVKTMRMGAYDYLLKPFDIDELLVKVKSGLESK